MNRGAEVIPQIVEAAPVTLSLVFGAALIWVVVSIVMGLVAAVFRGTPLDTLIMVVGLIGISIPVFWLGEVVNLLSQSRLHDTFLFSWVPPLGYTPFTRVADRLVQVAAPALADPVRAVHRRLRARAPLEPDRGAGGGLRPHRAGEGAPRSSACCCGTRCGRR